MVSIGRTATKKGKGVLQSVLDATDIPSVDKAVGAGLKKLTGWAGDKVMDSADADEKPTPKKPGSPVGPMGSGVQQRRGSAKAAPSYGKPATGATSGSISKPSAAYKAAQKKSGDAYLANTDYGIGSAVNDFVNKKKK